MSSDTIKIKIWNSNQFKQCLFLYSFNNLIPSNFTLNGSKIVLNAPSYEHMHRVFTAAPTVSSPSTSAIVLFHHSCFRWTQICFWSVPNVKFSTWKISLFLPSISFSLWNPLLDQSSLVVSDTSYFTLKISLSHSAHSQRSAAEKHRSLFFQNRLGSEATDSFRKLAGGRHTPESSFLSAREIRRSAGHPARRESRRNARNLISIVLIIAQWSYIE